MFSDKFRQYSSRAYAERREYIAKNTADIIAAQKDDMRTALEYLYGTLPPDDVRFTPFEWMEEACAAALETRAANQYGVDIPEDIFAQYVLCTRVNNERAQRHRRFFAEKLKARVQGKSIADAALSVNLWCCEQVTYHSSDDRTEGPITAYLSGIGRCGEESAFAVCALRSVGIPARQVYSPWWSHCDDNTHGLRCTRATAGIIWARANRNMSLTVGGSWRLRAGRCLCIRVRSAAIPRKVLQEKN